MRNTSTMCRQQEANHRRIATDTLLENVRTIALSAAKVWGEQAREAEARETGGPAPLSDEDTAIALEFLEDEAGPSAADTWLDHDRWEERPARLPGAGTNGRPSAETGTPALPA